MKIRIGDVVFYYEEDWKGGIHTKEERYAIVDGTSKDWWCIKNHISIHRIGNMGSIIPIKDVFSIIKREDLEKFWRFL